MVRRFQLVVLPQLYRLVWNMACLGDIGLAVYMSVRGGMDTDPTSKQLFISVAISIARLFQFVMTIDCTGFGFSPVLYSGLLAILTILGVASTVLYAVQWRHTVFFSPTKKLLILIWVVYHDALCLAELLGQYVFNASWTIRRCLDDCLLEDAISPQNIECDTLPLLITLDALAEDVSHWSRLAAQYQTQEVLWIATDGKENNSKIADKVFNILSTTETGYEPLQIDVGHQRSVQLPLIRKLAGVFPRYTAELARILRTRGFYRLGKWARNFGPGKSVYEAGIQIYPTKRLLVKPLKHIHRIFGSVDSQNQNPSRTVLIIHDVRIDQADEMHELILTLKHLPELWNIVVIGQPDLLHYDGKSLMEHVHTLYLSDSGLSMYSGKNPTAPPLYENIFHLLLERVWHSANEHSQRIWAGLCERRSLILDLEGTHTTADIFQVLLHASDACKWMMKSLSSLSVTYTSMQQCHKKDNVKICQVIRLLFEIDSYKSDILRVPEDQAFAVLNMTHALLDSGLPDDSEIKNDRAFMRRAHRLLRRLADLLKILPEALDIHGVVLINERPVNYGGFADIYHGQYTNDTGEQEEVALKVLKIFHDQSDSGRRVLHEKFAKEALSWSYLKHENVVPFLGVDSSTFAGHTMAMVSKWMPQGSVLTYMIHNSPCSDYAIHFIHDIIMGVSYLHSVSIVHGDLCGRNVLISDEGRARLTDFGLAAFVELETSIKSSTRGGSTRWMAPELLLPDVYQPGLPFRRTIESDVWAFACVCCEIWSEGAIPFAGMSDGALIMTFSSPETDKGSQPILPYGSRPHDKGGRAMPMRLWELVQSCWKRDAASRPTVQVIEQVISEIKEHGRVRRAGFSRTARGSHENAGSPSTLSVTTAAPPAQHTLQSPGNGNSRQRCPPDHATVCLGPLAAHGDPDAQFRTLLNNLLDVIERRDVLVPPHSVSQHDSQHLDLCFTSGVEANSFALTWMAYRFAPYGNVAARLVKGDL
ncbi:Serine/threonine-protein kinase STY8 [Mycena venus]|uniref:Serine/threonine-protein kinase STY8 n=1 Tax=Mycena venus TaxID=2733690 RepID=A0A8H6Z2L4_9AGAR|nr:Serine/threonine-protein kinase STY8 [Mycena venus]